MKCRIYLEAELVRSPRRRASPPFARTAMAVRRCARSTTMPPAATSRACASGRRARTSCSRASPAAARPTQRASTSAPHATSWCRPPRCACSSPALDALPPAPCRPAAPACPACLFRPPPARSSVQPRPPCRRRCACLPCTSSHTDSTRSRWSRVHTHQGGHATPRHAPRPPPRAPARVSGPGSLDAARPRRTAAPTTAPSCPSSPTVRQRGRANAVGVDVEGGGGLHFKT